MGLASGYKRSEKSGRPCQSNFNAENGGNKSVSNILIQYPINMKIGLRWVYLSIRFFKEIFSQEELINGIMG